MPEATSEEPSPIVLNPPDHGKIRAYCGLNSDETLRLAALMSPKQADPQETLAAVKALRSEADADLLSQRELIAASMDHDTLWETARQLGADAETAHFRCESDFTDPVSGPILRRISQEEFSEHVEFEDVFTIDHPEIQLSKHEKLTNQLRPSSTCNIEAALRYAVNDPNGKVPSDVLSLAFMDCLRVFPLIPKHQDFVTGFVEAQNKLIQERPPELPSSKKPHKTQEKNEWITEFIKEQDDATCFRDTFVPGMKAPNAIEYYAKEAFEKHWNVQYPVLSEKKLAWLTAEFHTFWEKHGAASMEIAVTAAKAKQLKSKAMAEIGKIGRANKQLEMWTDHTNNLIASPYFSEFMAEKTSSNKAAMLARFTDAVAEYSSNHPKTVNSRTKNKVTQFFGTLYTFQDHDLTIVNSDQQGTIREIHVKMQSSTTEKFFEKTIVDCHKLLRKGLGKSSSRLRLG